MQIDRVLYPITTLGPGNRLGIWTVGCPHHCFNCSNPELWEKDETKDIELTNLFDILREYVDLAEGVTITGGEPFCQSEELYYLVMNLKKFGYTDILVYTGYQYDLIKEKHSHILNFIDVLVDGLYIDSLNDNIGHKGSSNQRCILLNSEMKHKYKDFDIKIRQRQNFITNNNIISVGIPFKE